MEFLLQLMSELFDIESLQPEMAAVAETVNNEKIHAGFLQPTPFEPFQPDDELAQEEGLIFNYVQFN
ncbi:MAG: hypothetical protein FWH18_04275 [Marinilabiliaceae bacterium]|nr:hypothetical protein [Marinilabiliaceae bacterium]